jgi:hypothetical protein
MMKLHEGDTAGAAKRRVVVMPGKIPVGEEIVTVGQQIVRTVGQSISTSGFARSFPKRSTISDCRRRTGPKLETQLTSHNDGGYYRIHNDNGSPSTATRVLTYVYYFHRQPVAFKGGQLRLYDSRIQFGRLSVNRPSVNSSDEQ